MPKMEHKINYFYFQPSVQSVELFNLWSKHPRVAEISGTTLQFSHFQVQCDLNGHFFAQMNYFARVKVIHIARGRNLTTIVVKFRPRAMWITFTRALLSKLDRHFRGLKSCQSNYILHHLEAKKIP